MCVCACACMHMLSHVPIFVTPWSVACQAPLEWVGIPFSRGSSQLRVHPDLFHLLRWQADSLPLAHILLGLLFSVYLFGETASQISLKPSFCYSSQFRFIHPSVRPSNILNTELRVKVRTRWTWPCLPECFSLVWPLFCFHLLPLCLPLLHHLFCLFLLLPLTLARSPNL